jgi:hypothetical protein
MISQSVVLAKKNEISCGERKNCRIWGEFAAGRGDTISNSMEAASSQ